MRVPSKIGLSAFDLDGTLIKGNSSFHFGRFLYQQGYLPRSSMMRLVCAYASHRYFGLPQESLHQTAFRLFFQGRQRAQLDDLVAQFLEGVLPRLWYQAALDHLQAAKSLGHHIAILSSSPDFLVSAMAARLGIGIWHASVYPIDSKGCLMHSPRILTGEAKAERLAEIVALFELDLAHTVAYSDSILDLPFLLKAGRSVGVRPDRALRKWCVQRSWEVI